MKKNILFFVLLVTILMPGISNAKSLDYDYYKKLNVKYAFIVGDYMFNMDDGFSPTLEDIMIASRTIDDNLETTLYEVRMFPAWNYFTFNEIYRKTNSTDKNLLENMNVKYVYRKSIKKATSRDYDILS